LEYAFGGGSRLQLWRGSVIAFIEQTWFLWWILATLIILRWFHLFSSNAEGDRDAPSLDEEQAAAIASGPRGSGSMNRRPFAA
jgi:hypothetical protein